MSRTSRLVLVLIALLLASAALAAASGASRWRRTTSETWDAVSASGRGSARDVDSTAARGDSEGMTALPPPVARYFATVLHEPGRRVRRATLRHEGEFALKPNQWKSFTSRQLYVTAPRGFVWDAEIAMLPFVPIRVRDGYFLGRGTMTASLGGFFPIVDAGGSDAMGDASLLRYLAEAAWLPTALLPSEGVAWSAIDDSTARATLVDGAHRVALNVHFGAGGGIVRVTGERGRDVDGRMISTPWEGPFSDELLDVDGMRIPKSGEVAWLLPEGRFAYWRGRVVEAQFDFR